MSRWGHGHSIGVGLLLGTAVISAHYLWTLTLVFVLGLVLGRLWERLGWLLRRLAGRRTLVVPPGRWQP